MLPLIQFRVEDNGLDVSIETEHLFIRPYRDEDLEESVRLYGDPRLTRFFDYGRPLVRTEVEELAEKGKSFFHKGEPFGLFSVFDKETKAFIGHFDMFPVGEPGSVEIGGMFNRLFQGKGLFAEIGRCFCYHYAEQVNDSNRFPAHVRIRKIIATAHPENTPSHRVVLRVGFRFDRSEERFGYPRYWYSYIPGKKGGYRETLWDPGSYRDHSRIQYDAAIALLDRIPLEKTCRVLDVGCGDGKITALIAKHFVPEGSVLGIDLSPQMIAFAAKTHEEHPNLRFEANSAERIDYPTAFDIVFSSFALQWVLDLKPCFQGVRRSLAPSGLFAATIPLGVSSALEQAIQELLTDVAWAPYFSAFKQEWDFKTPDIYRRELTACGFRIETFATVQQTFVFETRELFEAYVRQWFPYLHPLPEELKPVFFKAVIDRYLALQPLSGERVNFAFPRLDITAIPS